MMKNIIRFTVIFVCILFLCSHAYSQPSVSGTSGTFTHGGSVTISGSSFGAHGDYHTESNSGLAFAWEDFESETGFTSGTSTTGGFAVNCTDSNCSRDWLLATTTNRTNSTKWARRIDAHDTFACNTEGLKKPGDSGASYSNVAFISFWFKVPDSSSGGKLYRQWSGSGATSDMGYSTIDGSCSNHVICTWDYNPDGIPLEDEVWQRLDYVQTSSTHMDLYVLGLNGNDVYDSGGIPFEGGSGSNGYFQAVPGSGKDYGTNPLTDYFGYDDIYISFTRARVEICNSNTWSSRSSCEIQIPTSWSTSSIGIKVNRGAFGASDTAYLYVVDSSGNVSTAREITFGGGGGDTTAPIIDSITQSDPSSTTSKSFTINGTSSDAVGVTEVT